MLPFAGQPDLILDFNQQIQQSSLPSADLTQTCPRATTVYCQCVFASPTLVLDCGAFLARMSLKAWMLFVPLRLTFAYRVGACSIGDGGFLHQLGVMDCMEIVGALFVVG